MTDFAALSPAIVDMTAYRQPGLAHQDGIANSHTAIMPSVPLPIGDAMGRRVRNQNGMLGALRQHLRRLRFVERPVPWLRVHDTAAIPNSKKRNALHERRLPVKDMGQPPVCADRSKLFEVVVVSGNKHKWNRHPPQDGDRVLKAEAACREIAGANDNIEIAALSHNGISHRGIPMQVAER
jgi:hypothetical protein